MYAYGWMGGGATKAKGKTALSKKDEEVKLTCVKAEAEAKAQQNREERSETGEALTISMVNSSTWGFYCRGTLHS